MLWIDSRQEKWGSESEVVRTGHALTVERTRSRHDEGGMVIVCGVVGNYEFRP